MRRAGPAYRAVGPVTAAGTAGGANGTGTGGGAARGRRVATLKDVARVSGFSVSTVSRALTGIGSVDPRTRTLVSSVARELGYRPHAAAQLLVTRRSYVIGVIVATLQPQRRVNHPFLREMLDSLRYSAGDGNYDVLLLAGHPEESPQSFVHRAISRRVDGLILLGIDRGEIDRGGQEVAELASVGVPTVAFDVDIRGLGPWFGCVTSDNVGGGRMAVEHLVAQGRTKIACLTGWLTTVPGRERLEGYRQALDAAGFPYRDEYVSDSDFTEADGYRALRRMLSLREPPDAVFAAGDLMAIGAIRAIREGGLRVPEDVAVVGFDDIEVAAFTRPRLTTVRQDTEALAAAAVAMVDEMMDLDEDANRNQVLPVQLVVRESSGVVPA